MEKQTHRFVYSRLAARRIAGAAIIVFYSSLVLLIFVSGVRLNNLLELVVVVIGTAVALTFIVAARHPVTRLSVGPEGISVPFGLFRPILWNEVEKVEYTDASSPLFPSNELLIVKLKTGIPPVARVPLPDPVQDWLRRAGLRIPLHMLRAQSTEILSAIEDYVPVIETDLEPKSPKISTAE